MTHNNFDKNDDHLKLPDDTGALKTFELPDDSGTLDNFELPDDSGFENPPTHQGNEKRRDLPRRRHVW